MSFSKARDLLRLAIMAGSRHSGVMLSDIVREFGVSHRTAQRMTDALEEVFVRVEVSDDAERRRHWVIRDDPDLRKLRPLPDREVEALDIAIRDAEETGRARHAQALRAVRDQILKDLAPRDQRRVEVDAEAVLSALGTVTRPGPRVLAPPDVTNAIIEALRGPFRLRIFYEPEHAPPRIVEPHGVLLGLRNYLVARQPERDERLRRFRFDRIRGAECLDESFEMEPGFSIEAYGREAFAAFHDPDQYGPVVWRFLPGEAAAAARAFRFHPDQELEDAPDGSLVVRFRASGWLEMTWFLYQWGDKVEVLEPPQLRQMTENWRRADFGALP